MKPKQVHPDGTGYARGLYTLQGLPPEAANVVETRFLKDADNLGAVALRAFVENRDLDLALRTAWSRFTISLLLRNPEAVEEMKTRLRQNVQKQYDKTRKPTDPLLFEESGWHERIGLCPRESAGGTNQRFPECDGAQ